MVFFDVRQKPDGLCNNFLFEQRGLSLNKPYIFVDTRQLCKRNIDIKADKMSLNYFLKAF